MTYSASCETTVTTTTMVVATVNANDFDVLLVPVAIEFEWMMVGEKAEDGAEIPS
jgi:hypothetical protein